MGTDDFCRQKFDEDQVNALTVCTLVASILSVIGSSFMLENFFLYDKGRNPLTKLVAWLAFGDYLTAVNNIIKSIMLLHYPDLVSWEVCVVMRAWFQIAAGSTWCYTSVIAYFLYRFMVSRNTTWVSWPLWLSFHIASWGVPSVGVVVMVAGNFVYRSPNTGLCYPTEPWHIILWFIPIICSFGWMLVCYMGIFYKVCRSPKSSGSVSPQDTEALLVSKEDDKRAPFLRIVIRFSFYILVFFVCWFFDVITYFILFFYDNCNVYAFVFGYTLFRNLQGLLDCLVYGMTNLKIRQRFTRSMLSAIVSMWELLLAPVLVLPASIAYANKALQPYFRSEKSDKIFVSINDDLMKDKEKKHLKKVPAHYFSALGESSEPGRLERWEERKERKERRRRKQEEEKERREGKEENGGEEEEEATEEGNGDDAQQRPRRADGRRPIPAYYFTGEPPANQRNQKKKKEKREKTDEQEEREEKVPDLEEQRKDDDGNDQHQQGNLP